MQKWLVCYDTPDDRRRLKVARLLDGYGDRVQYSVFEVRVAEGELAKLQSRLLALLDPAADSLRMYPACEACAAKVVRLGRQEPEPWWAPEVYIV